MNTIYLSPTDVLFFRDGRPMRGASSGNGAAWPLPHVLNAALHAALHRADLEDVHVHCSGRSGTWDESDRSRKFGGLITAGPFPVNSSGDWFFPRPADAQIEGSWETSLKPYPDAQGRSSLHESMYPVVNTHTPTKKTPEPWMNRSAWLSYLLQAEAEGSHKFLNDAEIADTEHQIGISIDAQTGATLDGGFYSAHYLRLRPEWRMAIFAEAMDKQDSAKEGRRDLVLSLLDKERHLLIGGQQRVCSADLVENAVLPLPMGSNVMGTKVRWTLLTPSVFPIVNEHPGGWLPSWVDEGSKQVKLLDGPGKNKARRLHLKSGEAIKARLVGAVIPGSVPVTGWSIGENNGAKALHLAVPAGSVYYFDTESAEQAEKLADALNWHGASKQPTANIVNRRSTLFGEKGFGIGVCSSWQSYSPSI